MILRGKVKSGQNKLSYYMEKLEYYYTEKTGMKFFSGSLNVELDVDFIVPNNVIIL